MRHTRPPAAGSALSRWAAAGSALSRWAAAGSAPRRWLAARRPVALLAVVGLLGLLAMVPPVAGPARGEILADGAGAAGGTGQSLAGGIGQSLTGGTGQSLTGGTGQPLAGGGAADTSGGSAVTVRGGATYPEDFTNLEITVSQTRDLVNQAVVVTWKGGAPTPRTRLLGVDYLQFMQCWGDPTAQDDPHGLRFRETCQFGAELDYPKMPQGVISSPSTLANSRRVGLRGFPGYPEPQDDADETLPDDAQIVPFQPVGRARTPDGSAQNPFPTIKSPIPPFVEREAYPEEVLAVHFNKAVSNEYPFALTAADGTGRISFEVQNSSRAPDLGCGEAYTDAQGTTQPSRPCWLVIVPRGHRHPYNGTDISATDSVHGSPLSPANWRHRIVVKLEFEPVSGYCSTDQAERLTAGTEFAAEAVISWRPALCRQTGGASVSYSPVGDFDAGTQLLAPTDSAPGLVYTSEPVRTSGADPPVIHAPVTLSGLVVAMNIDVNLDPDKPVDEELERMRGAGLRELKLTPRLVAKLLTQSYRRDIPGTGGPVNNPNSIKLDPEFLDLNPVFKAWDRTPSVTLNGLMVPNGSSVAARGVWAWLLADPVASAWLRGAPDENGMVVNPEYAQLFGGGPPDYYPKADRTCYEETAEGDQGPVVYRLCSQEYRPYVGGLGKAAEQTLRADTGGSGADLITENLPPGELPKFVKTPRDQPGFRFAMALTDTASAARYGLFAAQLCSATRGADEIYRATDCRSATPEAMSAAAATAQPSEVDGVTVIDPGKAWTTPGAYPLSLLTYAVADTSEPAAVRADYAKLLRHAGGAGQEPGFGPGSLPEGYVPLPQAMRSATLAAADRLRDWRAPAATTPPAATDPPGAPVNPPAAPPPPPPSGVPSAGPVPSPGGTAPSRQPPATRAARTTPGTPIGNVRYLVVGILVLGLIGGVAGPILRRLGTGYPTPDSDK